MTKMLPTKMKQMLQDDPGAGTREGTGSVARMYLWSEVTVTNEERGYQADLLTLSLKS